MVDSLCVMILIQHYRTNSKSPASFYVILTFLVSVTWQKGKVVPLLN
jgi:hypothetical protein